MNVLLTGSSGLVGQHLASLLCEKNINVIGYDRVSNQFSNSHFKFEQGELQDYPRLADITKRYEIDAVIHSGGISHPLQGNDSSNQVIQTNIVGTNNIFEVSRLFDVKKVVYLSSGAAYGNNKSASLKENEKRMPTSVYGVSKVTGEFLAQVYCEQHGMNITTLRLPFVYGPGRKMPDPINELILQAIKEKEILVEGTGQQFEFIHVKDAAEAIWLALTSENSKGEIFNIGTGTLTSTEEIASIVKRIFPETKMEMGKETVKYDQMGPFDCTKAKEILGYEPSCSLESGIVEYADWIMHT